MEEYWQMIWLLKTIGILVFIMLGIVNYDMNFGGWTSFTDNLVGIIIFIIIVLIGVFVIII